MTDAGNQSPPTLLLNTTIPSGETRKPGQELQEGLRIVQQATVADQAGNIDEAVQLYSLALELLEQASDSSKEDAVKELIMKKSKMYMSRMEHLRLIILQSQFPDIPEENPSTDLEALEKQFADTPISDHGFVRNQPNPGISLVKETKNEPMDSPPSYPSVSEPTSSPPAYREVDSGVGPQDPEVIQGIEEAAKLIGDAKDAETSGNVKESISLYKKGLCYLYKAYEKEKDLQVKELVRVKYNCLVSRMEEMENTLDTPKGFTPSAVLTTSMATIDEYTTKARTLADNFNFTESIKYYNMAMAEIKKTMAREDVAVAKKWLAKRALVTERRIGGISSVLKVVKVALPYPWSKLFTIIEFGLRTTGLTDTAQNKLERSLSKMAGIKEEPVEVPAVDLSKNLDSKKKNKKKK